MPITHKNKPETRNSPPAVYGAEVSHYKSPSAEIPRTVSPTGTLLLPSLSHLPAPLMSAVGPVGKPPIDLDPANSMPQSCVTVTWDMSVSTAHSHAKMQGLSNWMFDRLMSHSASKYGLRVDVAQFGKEATTSGFQSLARAREIKLTPMSGSNGFSALNQSSADFDLCMKEIGSLGLLFTRSEHIIITDGDWYGPSASYQADAIVQFQKRQQLDRSFGVVVIAVGPLEQCNVPLLKSLTLRRRVLHLKGDKFDPIFTFIAKLGRTVSESAPGDDYDLPVVDGIAVIE